VNYILNN